MHQQSDRAQKSLGDRIECGPMTFAGICIVMSGGCRGLSMGLSRPFEPISATRQNWMRKDARLGLIGVIGALVLFAWHRRGEQLARAGDVLSADAASEQAVVD